MDRQTSIALLKDRLNLDAKDVEAAVALGNLYYDDGNPSQAIVYYRLALDVDPSLSAVRTDMGTMYWRNDNIAQAELAFRDAIERDASFGHAYVNLGLLLQHARGDNNAAREVWQKLVAEQPEHPVAGKAMELIQSIANA